MMSERRNLARNPGNRIYLGTPTSRYYHIIILYHIHSYSDDLPPFTGVLQIRTSVTSKLTESQRHMWSYVFQSYVKLLKICFELLLYLLLRTPRTPLFHLVSNLMSAVSWPQPVCMSLNSLALLGDLQLPSAVLLRHSQPDNGNNGME